MDELRKTFIDNKQRLYREMEERHMEEKYQFAIQRQKELTAYNQECFNEELRKDYNLSPSDLGESYKDLCAKYDRQYQILYDISYDSDDHEEMFEISDEIVTALDNIIKRK